MAIVRVELFPRPQEQRDAIIKGITDVLVANGAIAEGVQVILYEIEPDVWGKGGKTFARRMQEQGVVYPPPSWKTKQEAAESEQDATER